MIAGLLMKVASMEAGEQDRQAYRIRPSGISVHHEDEWYGRCPRAAVYDRLGFLPAPRPGRMVILLEDSSFAEHLTADWIRKTTYTLHSEQMGVDCMDIEGITLPAWHCDICHSESRITRDLPVEGCTRCLKPGYRLHGHIDGILQDLEGLERVYEHKAVNHFAFDRYWKGELPISYIVQPCIYLIGLKKLLVELKEILLVIKNKGSSQYLDYLIEYDQDKDVALIKEMEHSGYGKVTVNRELKGLVGSAVEEFQKTEWHYQASKELNKPVLPPRPFHFDDWQCSYCPWGLPDGPCWSGYEAEFQKLESNSDLGEDFAGLMAREIYLAKQESEAKKAREELREKFKKITRDEMGIRSGLAESPDGNKYTFELSLGKRKKTNWEKIPQDILREAQTEEFSETLRIREVRSK